MLPFSKRKNAGEEIELDDDDLVLVESPSPSFVSASPPPRVLSRGADAPPTARPRRVTASVSRRIIDESVADGVAGECLSAIAEASRDRHSSSHVRPSFTRPPSAPPPRASAPPPALSPPAPPDAATSAATAAASRLPSVSPPPFVRTTTTPSLARPLSPFSACPPSPSTYDSTPPPAFVRRSSPMIAIAGAPGSDAPMSVSPRTDQPTVIVVRERPKAGWVIGAAAIGAVFAVLASRLVMSNDAGPSGAASPPALTSAATPPLGTPAALPTVVVAPVIAPASAPVAPSASVAVMRFGDDQGVAFKAPPRPPLAAAPASSASSAPRPRVSAVGPALPDGSLSLGASPGTTTRTSAVAAPPPTPAPPTPAAPKRALTPEQQLAEAQLKASMR